jgi:hypothetical protein
MININCYIIFYTMEFEFMYIKYFKLKLFQMKALFIVIETHVYLTNISVTFFSSKIDLSNFHISIIHI